MTNQLIHQINKKIQLIHDAMHDMPGNLYIKDAKGTYLYANKNQVIFTGTPDISNLIGKSDFQTPWAPHSDELIINDQKVMSTLNPIKSYELLEDVYKEKRVVLSHKKPFLVDNKLVGIWGMSLEVSLTSINNNALFSTNMNFIDITNHHVLKLTDRQKEIVYYLLKSMHPKEIAYQLKISIRTVEHHIEHIKECNGYHFTREILIRVKAI